MHKVLLAWLGMTDLRAAKHELDKNPGPIGQAARSRSFTHIFLLSDHDRKAEIMYADWLRFEEVPSYVRRVPLAGEGLATPMDEVRLKRRMIIKADVMAAKHSLNVRQKSALRFLLEHGKMTIQDYETPFPQAHRRSLQRDLQRL